LEREETENRNGIEDPADTDNKLSDDKPGSPPSPVLYAIGLAVFSLVYLIIVPLTFIPSTFDPEQHCGVPLLGFVCVGIPIIIYGLMRWLTFPYIRQNARKFHIAAFALDVIAVSIATVPLLSSHLAQNSQIRLGCLNIGGCLESLLQVLWFALPAGALVITIWSFFSLGRARKRWAGYAAWAMVVIYIVALTGFIIYSQQPGEDSSYQLLVPAEEYADN
jgi:hypothetical protein